MKITYLLLLLPVLFLLLVTPAYAVSSNYFIKAQEFYSNKCVRNPLKVDGSTAVLCYAYDKLQELTTSFNQLTQKVDTNTYKIQTLENELSIVKASNSALLNKIEVFENSRTNLEEILIFPLGPKFFGAESEIIDTKNHKMMVLSADWQWSHGTYDIFYSDDKTNWFRQPRGQGMPEGLPFGGAADSKQYVQLSFPIKGKFYKLVVSNGQNGFISQVSAAMY